MIEKIPIEEAIQAGSWLTCENDDCRLKIRLDAFREMETNAVAAPARMQGKRLTDTKAVILYVSIINACNNMLVYQLLESILRLIDGHGCDYRSIDSAQDVSLFGACPLTDKNYISPQELTTGKLTFIIPEKSKEFYFGIVEGSMQED